MIQPTDFFSQEDYEAALNERVASPSEARAEFAANAGAETPERAWILTPWDTWEANPCYAGPPVRHPEVEPDDLDEGDVAAVIGSWQARERGDDGDEFPF